MNSILDPSWALIRQSAVIMAALFSGFWMFSRIACFPCTFPEIDWMCVSAHGREAALSSELDIAAKSLPRGSFIDSRITAKAWLGARIQAGGQWIAIVLSLMGLAGCSSPQNLLMEVPRTTYRHEGEKLPPIRVELRSDKRPSHQRGLRQYPGNSWLTSDDVLEPTDVTLLRALVRDLRDSGLSPGANLARDTSPLILQVDILELGAMTSEGVESLAVVLPTAGIEAPVAIRLSFGDDKGRLFLSRDFSESSTSSSLPFLGTQGARISALASGIRAVLDRALPALAASYREYWQDAIPGI
jgi:hypothetical protein